MKKSLFAIIFIFLVGITGVLAQSPTEKAFSNTLTKALKNQDRTTLYSLICFDRIDGDLKESIKKSFESVFKDAKEKPNFTASLRVVNLNQNKPPQLQAGEFVYNLSVTTEYCINWPDTTEKKNRSTTFYLGTKNGKVLISGLVPKPKQ